MNFNFISQFTFKSPLGRQKSMEFSSSQDVFIFIVPALCSKRENRQEIIP